MNCERYAQLNRAAQCQLKLEKRETFRNSVAEQAEDAACRNEFRTLYATMRRLTGQKKTTISLVAPSRQRWKEFFEKMSNQTAPGGPRVAPPSVPIPETVASDTAPAREEVVEAIKLLRNTKTAGIDGVTAKALKAGGEILVNRSHSLQKLVRRAEKIPTAWKQTMVIPVLKKGDGWDFKQGYRNCKNSESTTIT